MYWPERRVGVLIMLLKFRDLGIPISLASDCSVLQMFLACASVECYSSQDASCDLGLAFMRRERSPLDTWDRPEIESERDLYTLRDHICS